MRGPDRIGELRCLPVGLTAVDVFSDASCSLAVRVATELRIEACSSTPPPAYAIGGEYYDPGSTVYRVGAETTATFSMRDAFSGDCVSARATNRVFFEIQEIDPTSLALLSTMGD